MKDDSNIVSIAETYARKKMISFEPGHDWLHILRVRKLAWHINSVEKAADALILDIAAILHDTVDSKFNTSEDPYGDLQVFLTENGMKVISGRVLNAVKNVSFSNKKRSGDLNDPVLLILQDADRLDAIGAVGIARAFSYGSFRNNPIYVPEHNTTPGPSTIGHFHEKLLKLKDLMNTETGKKLAIERHRFLEVFLEQFYKEIKKFE